MAYKVLGYVVWNGGKWFVRRKYGHLVPSQRVAIAGLAGVAALGVVTALAVSRSGGE